MGEKINDIRSIPTTLRSLAEAQPAIQKDWADLIGMADAIDANLTQQAVDVGAVHTVIAVLCAGIELPLDVREKLADKLTAALPKDSDGAERVGS